MLESYFSFRRFQSPFLRSTEMVSPLSALWAFLLGPIYYWRKRAPIEAVLSGIAMMLLLFVDDDGDILGTSAEIDLGSTIWLTFALAAPVLLPTCYRRMGWVEISTRSQPSGQALAELPGLDRLGD